MKALTICQPYAHLIAIGDKRIENRTWPTNYRGRIAIHAGLSRRWLLPGDEERYPNMAFGAVVATVTLADCLSINDVRRLHPRRSWIPTHAHTEGPVCWVLDNLWPLETPVPCRGHRSLWDLPSDVEELVLRYLAADPAWPGSGRRR